MNVAVAVDCSLLVTWYVHEDTTVQKALYLLGSSCVYHYRTYPGSFWYITQVKLLSTLHRTLLSPSPVPKSTRAHVQKQAAALRRYSI